MTMEGICCECQEPRPVHLVRPNPSDWDDDDEEDEEERYVMTLHDAYGSPCQGTGTMPQALLPKADKETRS